MPLKFLNQFDDNQIIVLLNYVYEETPTQKVNQVQVFREPKRYDEFGNQVYIVSAWNDGSHVGMYSIQDFTIKEHFSPNVPDARLRDYIASIFEEEYLNALREYYAIKADREIERIKSTLGEGRS